MEVPTVLATGFVVVRAEESGRFMLTHWVRSSVTKESQRTDYGPLAHAEMVDLVDVLMDRQRPGYQLIDGLVQPALFD